MEGEAEGICAGRRTSYVKEDCLKDTGDKAET